ncbi:hypothetical protein [Mycoplasma suis]|uniref:Uncharacterized protein n=1 Tax=Mycoplasma suis (strain Illinois) TaxID=768700 RepID=F0QQM6_MYCSL|nr:hypothetical protein [Mycoplasma suis]ADX97796.1 hypothetical protein MSU_0252 [Mycoplasma suis str. Illinois]
MSIISLTKGIITLSTAGGAALGGYFAKSSFSDFSNETENQEKKLFPKSERRESIKDDADSKKLEVTPTFPREKDESFDNQVPSQIESNHTTGIKDPTREESLMKKGASWDDFLNELENNSEFKYWDKDNGEEQEEIHLVSEYIRYYYVDNEEERSSNCETWYSWGDNIENIQKNKCSDFSEKRSSWGERSSYKPAIWLKVDMDYSERALREYKLIDETTDYKKTNGSWTTKNWLCTLEKVSGNFLIACDFYQNPKIT